MKHFDQAGRWLKMLQYSTFLRKTHSNFLLYLTLVYEVSMPVSPVMWVSRWMRPRKFKQSGAVSLQSILKQGDGSVRRAKPSKLRYKQYSCVQANLKRNGEKRKRDRWPALPQLPLPPPTKPAIPRPEVDDVKQGSATFPSNFLPTIPLHFPLNFFHTNFLPTIPFLCCLWCC